MTLESAIRILAEVKPAEHEIGRYRQRDRLQHMIIPFLPAEDRDRFERAMNRYFGL